MKRSLGVAALAALAAMTLAACGSDDSSSGSSPSSEQAGVSGDVTVFAAASLTESFDEIGKRFEAANPDATVTFNFGGSSALAKQINEGAPADVFASASPKNMAEVTDAGNATDPTTFVSNTLMIAVPKGNPGGIEGLADFADDGKKIALCAPRGPVRRGGREGVRPPPRSRRSPTPSSRTSRPC